MLIFVLVFTLTYSFSLYILKKITATSDDSYHRAGEIPLLKMTSNNFLFFLARDE